MPCRNLFFSSTGQSRPRVREGKGVVMMGEKIVALRPKEHVRQDSEPIAEIYRTLGTVSAEQVVTRALGELTLAMAGLARQVRQRDLGDIDRQLRRLQRMADQLGLVSLCAVAGDARICHGCADATGFAAVWARLLRVAERSLSADKDLLDQTLS